MVKITRNLQKSGVLTIGLNQTVRKVNSFLAQNEDPSNFVVFLFNDKAHEEINSQMMTACKQIKITKNDQEEAHDGINHYILPKFGKSEVSKLFGVKHIMCFSVDLRQYKIISNTILSELQLFNLNHQDGKPSLSKFRYADDSLFHTSSSHNFRFTEMKKWSVVINPKNHKKNKRTMSV